MVDFRARILAELLLNLLHTNLQRLGAVRFGSIRMGHRGIRGLSGAQSIPGSAVAKLIDKDRT